MLRWLHIHFDTQDFIASLEDYTTPCSLHLGCSSSRWQPPYHLSTFIISLVWEEVMISDYNCLHTADYSTPCLNIHSTPALRSTKALAATGSIGKKSGAQ